MERKQLFDFMLKRVKETGNQSGLAPPQAFCRWFLDMYFQNPRDPFLSDGAKDGKVDAFFTTDDGKTIKHHVLNSKFTAEYNRIAPVAFYDEIIAFRQAFRDKAARDPYLEKGVKAELRPRYKTLFDRYDNGAADLMFICNCRRNDAQFERVRQLGDVRTFHLEDLLQYLMDDIDAAMPLTPTMTLTGIGHVLSPDKEDTEVATSIVFARLRDFIKYMAEDPNELLFARNIRLNLGLTPVNKAIRDTFRNSPREFAFSNNGITMLCDRHSHDPGSKELTLENPRVVNGSQTLHSIRDVAKPSDTARVMVRIIEIPHISLDDLPAQRLRKRGVINKISIRSNSQNPVKKWNLVATDEFQVELYRFFRRRNLFYERREKEWNGRSRQLRSMRIKRGPSIKRLGQLIACYYWDNKKLGPVAAKSVGELFDDPAYSDICEADPELAFQIFMLREILDDSYKHLARTKRYIGSFGGYIDHCLFSVIVKSLQSANVKWATPALSGLLERHRGDSQIVERKWSKLVKACIDLIVAEYRVVAKRFRRSQGHDLTYNNFFKNQSYIGSILRRPVPMKARALARQVVAA